MFFILFFFISFLSAHEHVQPSQMQVTVTAKKSAPVKIIFAQLGTDTALQQITQLIANDFLATGQFDPQIVTLEKLYTKTEMKKFFEDGVGFVLFLNKVNNALYEMRLYDTSEQEMIFGKKVKQKGQLSLSGLAHTMSDHVWPLLTGKKSSFASVIAATQKIKPTSKKEYSYIYVFYPTEHAHKKLIVNSPTLNIIPRWNPTKPLLYFSQHTPFNVRLVSVDPLKNQHIVANFDGLNMTPAFSEHGSIIISITKDGHGVLCKYFFDDERKRGVFRGVTSKAIHAVSPSFIDEDRVVFCLIKDRQPTIAILDLKTKLIEKITTSFSVSPSYSKAKNALVYCRKVNGFMQIFIYDCAKKEHRQLTFDASDKDECSWSPCGNMLVFSVDTGATSRIALFNIVAKKMTYITPADESWGYPSWSPYYDDFLFI